MKREGRGGLRDIIVFGVGRGVGFRGLLVEILLREINKFELYGGRVPVRTFPPTTPLDHSSRSAHASIKLMIVSQTLGMENYEIILAHAESKYYVIYYIFSIIKR